MNGWCVGVEDGHEGIYHKLNVVNPQSLLVQVQQA
jgi:hypothetical protein